MSNLTPYLDSAQEPIPAGDESPAHKNFTQMLNMAEDDLDPFQYRLLAHYVRWVGHNGTRREGIRSTATATRMSANKVRSTLNELVGLGYLKVKRPTSKAAQKGETVSVTVINRWSENVARYKKNKPVSKITQDGDGGVSDLTQEGVSKITHPTNEGVSNMTRIEEHKDIEKLAEGKTTTPRARARTAVVAEFTPPVEDDDFPQKLRELPERRENKDGDDRHASEETPANTGVTPTPQSSAPPPAPVPAPAPVAALSEIKPVKAVNEAHRDIWEFFNICTPDEVETIIDTNGGEAVIRAWIQVGKARKAMGDQNPLYVQNPPGWVRGALRRAPGSWPPGMTNRQDEQQDGQAYVTGAFAGFIES